MTLPYAFFTDGRASGVPIALWACQVKRATQWDFELGFVPIQGAYVACVQVSERRASTAIRPEFIRYGRTNRVGWVVRRERDAVGDEQDIPEARAPIVDPPPTWFLKTDPVVFDIPEGRADRTLLYGLPNERYRIFWTYDREFFEQFATELEADAERALRVWEVPQYMMEPFGTPASLGGLDLLSEWERGAVPRLLFPGERFGYHAGWYFKDSFTPAIFDATPGALRALYASEWLQWCSERVVQEDRDWPYLWSLSAVIRAAESGAPIPDLAKQLPAGGEMGKRAAEMRAYLYDCAKRGIRSRQQVHDAVNVGSEASAGPFGGWRRAAAWIAERTGLAHPALAHEAHLDQFYFPDSTKSALVAYFDMYSMGFDHQADAAPLALHDAQIQEALGWIRDKQDTLLASFSHPQLLRELTLHVPAADFATRLELGDRYHFQCASIGLPFWEQAAAKLATQEDWDRIAPYLKWLAEDADALAKMFEGLLDQYVAAYRLSAESVERILRYLYRYDLTLRGYRAEKTLPKATATLRLEYDPVRKRAVAKLYRGARATLLAEYELLTTVSSVLTGEAHVPLGPTHTDDGLKLFRRAMRKGQVREFVLAQTSLEIPDADAPSGFAKALATAGTLLNCGIAIGTLVKEVKKKGFEGVELDVYLDVVEETFSGIETVTDAVRSVLQQAAKTKAAQQAASGPLFAASHVSTKGGAVAVLGASANAANTTAGSSRSFVRAMKAVSNVGTVFEASRNLIKGGQTLATLLSPARSDTDLANYLERGETVPAWLEGTKGFVQIATGGAGIGTLLLGASTTVAAIPLSAVVVVGNVAVATLELIIYVQTGGGSPVDEYLKSVRRARRKQFKLSTSDEILKPDQAVRPEEVDPESGGPGPTSICTLARKLGTANEVAKQARLGSSVS